MRTVRTRAYNAWYNMHARCKASNAHWKPFYFNRGIKVCPEWRSRERFIADMGEPPVGASLDRIDNTKGYSKENCRWASRPQQTQNSRSAKLSEVEVKEIRTLGRGVSANDIAAAYGIHKSQVLKIVRGIQWKSI